jgi:hypothetical protein
MNIATLTPSQTNIAAPTPSQTNIAAPTPSQMNIAAPKPSPMNIAAPTPSQTNIAAPTPNQTNIAPPTPPPMKLTMQCYDGSPAPLYPATCDDLCPTDGGPWFPGCKPVCPPGVDPVLWGCVNICSSDGSGRPPNCVKRCCPIPRCPDGIAAPFHPNKCAEECPSGVTAPPGGCVVFCPIQRLNAHPIVYKSALRKGLLHLQEAVERGVASR